MKAVLVRGNISVLWMEAQTRDKEMIMDVKEELTGSGALSHDRTE